MKAFLSFLALYPLSFKYVPKEVFSWLKAKYLLAFTNPNKKTRRGLEEEVFLSAWILRETLKAWCFPLVVLGIMKVTEKEVEEWEI
jgi:hypothetical protein